MTDIKLLINKTLEEAGLMIIQKDRLDEMVNQAAQMIANKKDENLTKVTNSSLVKCLESNERLDKSLSRIKKIINYQEKNLLKKTQKIIKKHDSSIECPQCLSKIAISESLELIREHFFDEMSILLAKLKGVYNEPNKQTNPDNSDSLN